MKAKVSPRQKQILQMIGRGLSDREIGQKLGISENTVASHVRTVMDRFRARSRTHAVVRYMQG